MTPSQSCETVHVALGGRSYDILIGEGLLRDAGTILLPHLARAKTVIVTDDNVASFHLPALRESLTKAGIDVDTIVLPAGEATKSFDVLRDLLDRLLDLGVERNDTILAFGGGVIGDLVGFAASILRRGCRFVQIPTTLLAQVDSSVGGKTAINVDAGKNLVGAFYQPSLVLADIDTLSTLPARELSAGFAEVVKYGAIADAPFFEWLEENAKALLGGDKAIRAQAVRISCAAKAKIVAADEHERGERALLNFGHTFGHALEAHFGYSSNLLHGEAVALGMVLAMEYGGSKQADRLGALLKQAALPTRLGDLPPHEYLTAERFIELMAQDKKVESGALVLILASSIGAARVERNIDAGELARFLTEKLAS